MQNISHFEDEKLQDVQFTFLNADTLSWKQMTDKVY